MSHLEPNANEILSAERAATVATIRRLYAELVDEHGDTRPADIDRLGDEVDDLCLLDDEGLADLLRELRSVLWFALQAPAELSMAAE